MDIIQLSTSFPFKNRENFGGTMLRMNSRVRKAVEREGADHYVRLLLLSFAITVSVTRFYLKLTGYPQLGNGTLHIAHLLWGGLALFISAILMAVYANRWVYTWGSILAGVGVGLFIDEVGKFITKTNDYFYPPAAPIVYTLFLLVVLFYLEIRRSPDRDARSELYRVFDTLQEVLDRDLDTGERAALNTRLHYIVAQNENPDLTRLAEELLHFVESNAVTVVPDEPNWTERIVQRWSAFEKRWINQARLKTILVAGLGIMGIWAMLDFVLLFPPISSSLPFQTPLASLTSAGRLTGSTSLSWFLGENALKAACGLTIIVGAWLLIAGRNKPGIRISYLGLLIFITIVNLMEFYFDQFSTIVPATIQFGLLLILLYYRRRYDSNVSEVIS